MGGEQHGSGLAFSPGQEKKTHCTQRGTNRPSHEARCVHHMVSRGRSRDSLLSRCIAELISFLSLSVVSKYFLKSQSLSYC